MLFSKAASKKIAVKFAVKILIEHLWKSSSKGGAIVL